jgi:hypothetical protein
MLKAATICVATVALTIGAISAVVATGGPVSAERVQQASGTTLSARERALLTHVPAALRTTCSSNTATISQDFPGVMASLFCHTPDVGVGAGVLRTQYVQFSGAAAMNAAYQTFLKNSNVTENTGSGDTCPREYAYRKAGLSGRATCAILGGSGSVLEAVSTTSSSNILVFVEGRPSIPASQVWAYWRSSALLLKRAKQVK